MKLKPLVSLLLSAFAAPAVMASAQSVVISQVYGNGGNSGASYIADYVELFNAGSAAVSLSGWSVQYASASGTGNFSPTSLSGVTLQPGQYYLVKMASGGSVGAALPTEDASGSSNMSGTAGKVILANTSAALACNGGSTPCSTTQSAQIVDLVGWGTANFFEGTVGPATSSTVTSSALLRKNAGCTDTDNNGGDFEAGAPLPRNSATARNVCSGGGTPTAQPILPNCPDSTAAFGVASSFNVTATDADSIVNAAAVQGTWPSGITLGQFTPALAAAGTATQAVSVSAAVPVGIYTLNLGWSNNDAQSASCAIKLTVAGMTPIYTIQGSGAKSDYAGQTVSTTGVVTKLNNNGFFMQDPVGDGNNATSDGIFVFTSTAPTVQVGQLIELSGTVAEYNTGAATNAETLARTLTQLTGPTGITVKGSGYAITPVEVDLATLPADGLEAYEGMLVTLRGLTVQQNYFLGRYGQLTLATGGRVYTPTQLHRPGADAQALTAENKRRTLLLDDGSSLQNVNPTPYIGQDNTVRAGDTIDTLTGVVDYGLATASNTGFGAYKIHPTIAPEIARSNPRTAAPALTTGNVRIASANVLNFFTTFTNGATFDGRTGQGCSLGSSTTASNCRGADSMAEYVRQRDKIVASLSAINADVVGLMEIQNNGNVAVQALVDAINTKLGGVVYRPVPAPSQGTGTDAIRVAMIYKPAKVTLEGASLSDMADINNRPTFAQGFKTANGEKFAVAVNHLKSKGSCPSSGIDADQGDGQSCWNNTRVQQAQQLRSFVGQAQSLYGTSDVILLGDFNAHSQEDPIYELTSHGYIDQVSRFDPLNYSYIFDGGSGRLDHGLTTASMQPKVVGATSWHINADEPTIIDYNLEFKQPACTACGPDYYSNSPYRSSDHDPMVMELSLVKAITGTSGRDTIVGTPGDDIIEGGAGADTLTGNGGRNQFVYSTLLDGTDTITDFTVGQDLLVFTKLLQAAGVVSADPWASGHVTCTMSAGSAIIGIDTDGTAGPAKSRPMAQLKNVSCTAIDASSFKF